MIEEKSVREMLGLADKSKLISLFKKVLEGKEKDAFEYLKEFIDDGVDAKNFVNDILELLYLFSRKINLGAIEKDISLSESELKMIEEYSKNIDIEDIALFWQLTIKTIEDLKVIGNENLTLQMYIVQLVHIKNMEERKEINHETSSFNNQQENLSGKKLEDKSIETNQFSKIKNQLKSTNQIKTSPIKNLSQTEKSKIEIISFQDLIDQANKEREIELKFDLERNVKLVSFNKGKIDISFNEKLNKNFIKNLTEKLLHWTGERWVISLSKNVEAKSIYEKKLSNKNYQMNEFKKSKIANEIENAFPDAKLTDIEIEE